MTRRQTLEASRKREIAELERLKAFRWNEQYQAYKSAVEWREMRIANLDWHIANCPV